MDHPTREQQEVARKIGEAVSGKPSPESLLLQTLIAAQTASVNNQVSHASQCFTGSPGQSALVVCYVTCPDLVAIEMHQAVVKTIKEVLGENGLYVQDQGSPSNT
jgi:hypothetical protein